MFIETFTHVTLILGFTSCVAMLGASITRSFALSMIGLLTGFGFMLSVYILINGVR